MVILVGGLRPYLRFAVVGVIGLCSVACGGVSRDTDATVPVPSAGGAVNGGGAVGGGGGTAADAAGAGSATGSGRGASNSFDSPNTLAGGGLWMELGSSLPLGDPPRPHDGSALHLVGDSGAGLDFFFHTGFPIERYFSGVQFWVESELPDATLTIAVAGPYPKYFDDRDQGVLWPTQVVDLSPAWEPIDVAFSSLGIDKAHPGPHEETYGAVHFIVEPNTHYDFWIDDFDLRPAG